MRIEIKKININYETYGNEKGDNIVLLHGWGQNISMMKPIGDKLKKNYQVTLIDLPGFGASDEPDYDWSVFDYADAVYELLNKLKISNPIMMGHSFGGKVSLVYASKYDVKKLVLFASPYCREITKLSFKTRMFKLLKKVPVVNKFEGIAKKYIGSTDYRNASEVMRNVLVKTVNLDIHEEVKKIKCSTLLIWGTNDTAVPLERAYELEKLIPDAGVVVFERATHYAYLERLPQTIRVLNSFLGVK